MFEDAGEWGARCADLRRAEGAYLDAEGGRAESLLAKAAHIEGELREIVCAAIDRPVMSPNDARVALGIVEDIQTVPGLQGLREMPVWMIVRNVTSWIRSIA